MARGLLIFILIYPALSGGAFEWNKCPTTLAEWDAWHQMNGIWLLGGGASTMNATNATRRANICFDEFQKRTTDQRILQQVSACTKPKLEMHEALKTMDSFPANPTQAQVPSELLNPDFQKMLQQGKIDEALAHIEKLNATRPANQKFIAVPARASIPGFSTKTSRDRLLVYLPGEPRKYVSFTLPDKNDTAVSSLPVPPNISVISVSQGTNGMSDLHFADWAPGPAGSEASRQLSKSTNHGGKLECYSCHMNGPNQFVQPSQSFLTRILGRPVSGSEWQKFVDQTKTINNTMVRGQYHMPFSSAITGMSIGMDTFDDALMNRCTQIDANDYIPESLKADLAAFRKSPGGTRTKVKEMLNRCVQCHDGFSTDQKPLSAISVITNPYYFQHHLFSGNMPRSTSNHNGITMEAPLTRWFASRCLETWAKGDEAAPGAFLRSYTKNKCDPNTDNTKWLQTPDVLKGNMSILSGEMTNFVEAAQ